MRNLTPDQVASKWNSRANSATQDWVDGINSVTVSPGQMAAAQADTWLANLQASKPKWQAKLAAKSAQEWKSETIAKGQSRYGQGITAGQSKYQQAIAKVMAAEKNIVGSLPPRGSVENNIARSAAFQRAMHQAAASGQLSA